MEAKKKEEEEMKKKEEEKERQTFMALNEREKVMLRIQTIYRLAEISNIADVEFLQDYVYQ